jgi:hypothetical protein
MTSPPLARSTTRGRNGSVVMRQLPPAAAGTASSDAVGADRHGQLSRTACTVEEADDP